jgi:hypothetical protein
MFHWWFTCANYREISRFVEGGVLPRRRFEPCVESLGLLINAFNNRIFSTPDRACSRLWLIADPIIVVRGARPLSSSDIIA